MNAPWASYSVEANMPDRLEEADWKLLLDRIKVGECTPFLGAGVCYGSLPLASKIAEDWAREEGFPLDDCADLAKVAQFLVVKYDAIYPKKMLIEQFKNAAAPDFDDPYEPHRVLAELPLPIYITTNYDDFLFRALLRSDYAPGFKKNPRRELCKWNKQVRASLGGYPRAHKSRSRLEGDDQNPLVFHLHGNTELPDSMVLTEDDYLDFLINMAKDEDLLPTRIQQAFTTTSLLFMGYSLSDWNFRVLFRNVVGYLEMSTKRVHISVQLAPLKNDASEEQRKRAEDYLNRYFYNLKIRVYWGTAREFARELRDRWEASRRSSENRNVH